MANNFQLIQSSTIASGTQPTIVLSSIPQTYTDLRVIISTRLASNANIASSIKYNGATSTYSLSNFRSNNGTKANSIAASVSDLPFYSVNTDVASGYFAYADFYIPYYSVNTTHPSVVRNQSSNSTASAWVVFASGYWSSGAINSITLSYDSSSSAASQNTLTSISLYGISNA